MARKLNNHWIELLLKKTLLKAPRILPSSRPVDEQNDFPPF
jgi:hypothetical protein